MSKNPLHKVQISLIVCLVLLTAGEVSLRFHNDFLAGFGLSAGVGVLAISTWKRRRQA